MLFVVQRSEIVQIAAKIEAQKYDGGERVPQYESDCDNSKQRLSLFETWNEAELHHHGQDQHERNVEEAVDVEEVNIPRKEHGAGNERYGGKGTRLRHRRIYDPPSEK